MRILYICPFSHYTGHQSWAAERESQALIDAGAEVTVVTYNGLQNDREINASQLKATLYVPFMPYVGIVKFLRDHKLTQRLAMFIETCMTLYSAIWLPNIDAYFLRDGEPFPFLVHLLTFRKKTGPWIVTLTGTNLLEYDKWYKLLFKKPSEFFYTILLSMVNSRLWKSLYVASMKKNDFLYITQNEHVKVKFESYIDGVLKGKIHNLNACVVNETYTVSKEYARKKLQLPLDQKILLSFGNFHAGKDIETVLRAVKESDSILLYAGKAGLSTDNNNIRFLINKYEVSEKVVLYDYYIPEDEKVLFFSACDGIILSYKSNFGSVASVLWEAARYNLPVIASDNPWLGITVAQYDMGLIFQSQDSKSLKTVIDVFFKCDMGLFKSGLRRFAEDNSMSNWGENCMELYKKVVNG